MAYSFCLILAWTLVLLWTSIHRKAPTQDTCAHCQRSFTVRESSPPPLTTFRRHRAAHHTTYFTTVNTSRELFCRLATPDRHPSTSANSSAFRSRGAHPNRTQGFAEGVGQAFFRGSVRGLSLPASTHLVRSLIRVSSGHLIIDAACPHSPCAGKTRVCAQRMLARNAALIRDQHRNTCAGWSIFHRNKDSHIDHLRPAGVC